MNDERLYRWYGYDESGEGWFTEMEIDAGWKIEAGKFNFIQLGAIRLLLYQYDASFAAIYIFTIHVFSVS